MKKNFKRIISIYLALIMIFTVIPVTAYAAETNETETITVAEIEDARNLYSKTYETSENTNVIISSAVPLHYEEDGELKEIDNTLTVSKEDKSILTNESNIYNVELPKKYTDDSEIKIDYEGNSISFKLLNEVKSTKGNIDKTENSDVDETDAESVAYAESNIDKLSSNITYENLLSNTDFEYSVQPNSLKENIILNQTPTEDYSIQYELSTSNLVPVLNEDNSVSLVDNENNEVFLIDSPYMIDANENISENIAVSFEETELGYILTYSPDYSWLSSEDVSYPITIDPTVTILGKDSTSQNIEDTYVGSRLSSSQSKATTVSVQNSSTVYWTYYNIKKLPELPANSKITNLSLNLTTTAKVTSTAQLALYSLDSITDSSYVNNVVYSTASDATDSDKMTDISVVPSNSGTSFSFDLTNMATKLYSNETNNFILKEISGTAVVKLASSENTNTNRIPYISVEYVTVNGINDSYQYQEQDVGLGGTAYINDYTGNLIVERTEFASANNDGITFYVGEGVNTPKNNCFGENTSINYYQTLTDSTFADSDYILTYGDGTKEYISESSEKYSIIKSDDSIILNYYDNNDYISKAFTIEDDENSSDNNVYVLTTYEITKNKDSVTNGSSPSAKSVVLSYDAGYLVSLEDSISYYEFGYEDYLSEIMCYSNISNDENIIATSSTNEYTYNKYSYPTNNELKISIANNDDKDVATTYYEFDDSNNIIKITDETGLSYEYTYNDIHQVTRVQEYSAESTPVAGDYLTFEYGNNITTISDGKNTYTEYFDLSGKLMSIVDQDGNATFAQYENNLISKVSETRNSARNIIDFYGFEGTKDTFFDAENGRVDISNDMKFNGVSSAKLTISGKNETFFGTFKNLKENTTYTVSMWLYKDENTDCKLTLKNGDAEGNFTTVSSKNNNGWQQVYCTITTSESNNIYIELSGVNNSSSNTATIYVDNMYIQQSPYLTNINLLKNSDFSDELDNWTTDSSNVSVVSEDANISTSDNNRIKIIGDYSVENSISQIVSHTTIDKDQNIVPAYLSKGTKLTYGGWLKAVDSLPVKEGTDREISLSVYGIENDGSFTFLDKTEYSSYLSNWQYIENEITLPNEYYQFKFVISYNYQTGYVMFDGLSLSQDELYTTVFEYDNEGNITGITINGTTVSLEENSEEDDTEATFSDAYEYDTYGNIIKVTKTATIDDVAQSIVSKYEYGNNGSLLTAELGELGRWTNYKYDYFGNVASVIDANGHTVDYEYDEFQNLSAIIEEFESKCVNNNKQDETDSCETYTLKVQYTYTGSRLDMIETGNIENDVFTAFNTYSFEYDSWGNMTDIYINSDTPYIHYEYDETNYHQLNAVEYVNGQELHYIYDDDGNIIYTYDSANTDGDKLSYSYYYYNDGTCYGKKDNIAETIESYQDGLTTVKDFSGNVLHVYGYDTDGNLFEQIGDNFISVSEGNNSITTTVDDTESIVSTEYDDFGRIASEKLKTNNSSSYILKEYTYYDNNEDDDELSVALGQLIETGNTDTSNLPEIDEDIDTTNLVRYLTYYAVSIDEDNVESKTFLNQYRYLYYMNGNTLSYTIADDYDDSIFDVDKLDLFAYNNANMLYANSTYLYNYDSYGNISGVELNRDEDAENHLDFSYDENSGTTLNNCLTNIKIVSDGDAVNLPVSYDALGNINKIGISNITNGILNSANLEWSRGNVLDKISLATPTILGKSKTFDLINYEYDDNNLRTHKSINLSGVLGAVINGNFDNSNTSDIIENLIFNSSDTTTIDADIDYVWRDGKLVGENIDCSGSIFEEGNSQYGTGAGKYSIVILYDSNDNAYGLTINKTEDAEGNAVQESNTFYYLKDADNTINAIIDVEGNKLVEYEYDSYGMVMNIDNTPGYRYLMLLNPLAYRDYNYDIETGMYYLQSRYYAPYIGRFISADSVLDTGSGHAMCTHLYSYCENDPVNNIDPSGNLSFTSRTYTLSNSKFSLKVKISIALKTFVNKIKNYGYAFAFLSFINDCVPEPFLTKAAAIASGVASILCGLASDLLSKKGIDKKTLYMTLNMKGSIKTSLTYHALYVSNKVKFKFFYLYKTCYITSLGITYYVK